MFINANDKELLPRWARFVKGVINSPALLPTVSRNELVRDENYETIRGMLGDIILGYLTYLEKEVSFKLTEQSFISLGNEHIPEDILENLQPLKDKGFISEENFLDAVKNQIGDKQTGGYKTLILKHAEKENTDTLNMVVGAYNNTIKARSVEDDDFFDRICDLVRVNTSDGHMSMQAYLAKSDGTIYYFAERGTATQHKILFAHKGLPVIDD